MAQASYKVLSLDGGGSWALIQVMTLIDLYGAEAKGHDVLRRFDLVAANSGGSIVLAGLMEDYALTDILALFMDETRRRLIFQSKWGIFQGLADKIYLPRYSTAKKLEGLKAVMKRCVTATLSDMSVALAGESGHKIDFLITAFDFDNNHAAFFRSFTPTKGNPPSPLLKVPVCEAVHASSTAPVKFFDRPAVLPHAHSRYLDGGLTGCNNPALVAANEALQVVGDAIPIHVLSIGTGRVEYPETPQVSLFHRAKPGAGFFSMLKTAALAITDDPPDMATFDAHLALTRRRGAAGSVVRLNPLIKPFRLAGKEGWHCLDLEKPGQFLDRPSRDYQRLQAMDMDAVAQDDVDLIKSYTEVWLNHPVPVNQPIRIERSTLSAAVGRDVYRDAKNDWLALP